MRIIQLTMVLIAGLLLGAGSSAVFAGVPMDSFNSVNAGLVPAMAVDRSEEVEPKQGGPAQALLLMAKKSVGSVKSDKPVIADQSKGQTVTSPPEPR